MNPENFALASKLIGKSYSDQAQNNSRNVEKRLRQLLDQRKLTDEGLSEVEIEMILRQMAAMDSNNFVNSAGAGEREGRVVAPLVQRRHLGFAHGIGRSGDISAVQPKAAGSSLINKLTNSLLLDVLQISGVTSCKKCFLVPMATGMTLTLCLLTLRSVRPSARYVIWPRIDQKSCIKCILTAGFKPLVIEPTMVGDELQTNVSEMENILTQYGDEVLCVLSTTSCFAPRIPDKLVHIGQLCAQFGVPHLVNNAYGVQARRCMNLIEEASRRGRVDAFVQSADKNFLVPVGGAVVAGFGSDFVDSIAETYPGRASGTPTLDIFITLLTLGRNGWRKLLSRRQSCFEKLREGLVKLAPQLNQRLLHTPGNPISLALSLEGLPEELSPTVLGSMLFTRGISGARVVLPAAKTTPSIISGLEFKGFGSHSNQSMSAYLNLAAAIGQTEQEVDQILERLSKVFSKVKRPKEVSATQTVNYSGDDSENPENDRVFEL